MATRRTKSPCTTQRLVQILVASGEFDAHPSMESEHTSTSSTSGVTILSNMSWAIRSPSSTVN